MDHSIRPLTEEELAEQYAKDHDCDLAGREHKWIWTYGMATPDSHCTTCGKTRQTHRKDEALDHSSQQ